MCTCTVSPRLSSRTCLQAVLANLERAAALARALSALTPAGVDEARAVAGQIATDAALVRELLLDHVDALARAQAVSKSKE